MLAAPPGTVYLEVNQRWTFAGLNVKTESIGNDWYYRFFDSPDADDSKEWIDRLDQMADTGTGHPMDVSVSRYGLYNNDALFLVYDEIDVIELVATLSRAVVASRQHTTTHSR